ncbi:uncharacterized protein [Eurosta solidaginis]|uniref:uncharacterized protein isoform X2 n=1 Tax=Eurosta solidaginis TaxID=178769 RepID=UPI003530D2A7
MFEKDFALLATLCSGEMNSGETPNLFTYILQANAGERKKIKMTKSINNAQSEMLLKKMMQNPEIARGFSKENRGKDVDFWKQLSLCLNSLSPPIKSETEWKKVWNDQKRYVRKKASKNAIYARGTGGGPNKTQKLSTAEEAIYQLLDLKDSVEGIQDSHSYGVPSKKAKISSPIEIVSNIVLCDGPGCSSDDVPGCSTDLPISMADSEPVDLVADERECPPSDSNTQPVLQRRPKSNKKFTNTELIRKELETQQDLCGKLGEILAEIKPNNDRLCRTLDRMCDLCKRKKVC